MGFATARSGALVAPAVSKHAAEKAKERSATLKESRKFLEEQRLRRSPKGDQKGDPKGKGKGDDKTKAER